MDRILFIQSKFISAGYQWIEHIFNDGSDLNCLIYMTQDKSPHYFSGHTISDVGWGRFERSDAWERAYAWLVAQEPKPLVVLTGLYMAERQLWKDGDPLLCLEHVARLWLDVVKDRGLDRFTFTVSRTPNSMKHPVAFELTHLGDAAANARAKVGGHSLVLWTGLTPLIAESKLELNVTYYAELTRE